MLTPRARSRITRALAAAALALAALGLTACQDPAHQPVVGVKNRLPDLRFHLQSGEATVTERDVAGQIPLVFFGYANCPDICPTTMAHLAQVRRELGDAGRDVRILFISVDPHRDTPEVLSAYVRAFDDAHALGLAGSPREIQDLARRYRVSFEINKPSNPGDTNYEVSHSKGVFVFDRKGAVRYLVTDIDAPGSTAELTRVLRELAAEA